MKLSNTIVSKTLIPIGIGCIYLLFAATAYAQICDDVYTIAWSPDGDLIAVSGSEASCDARELSSLGIRIFDAETGQVIKHLQGLDRRATGLDWSSDGSKLVGFNSSSGTAYVWDVASEQVLIAEPLNAQGITLVKWQPNGDLIAFGTFGNSIIFLDTASESEAAYSIPGTTLDWGPDGTQLVTASENNNRIGIWDLSTLQEIISFNQNNAPVFKVEWSPDGTRILSSRTDDRAVIWDTTSGQALLTINVVDLNNAHWSPDSTKVATVSLSGIIQVWDASNGYLLDTLTGSFPTYDVAWNPDGSQLAYYVPSNQTIVVADPNIIVPTPTPDLHCNDS